MEQDLLQVKNLVAGFASKDGPLKAVDGISFSVKKGKTLGIVGESGCGKSVTSLSIMGLLDDPGKVFSGEIWFDGINLAELSDRKMQKIRGRKVSMIFQEPMTCLNPVYTIGEQIAEVYRIHFNMGRKEAFEKAINMLDLVNIPDPAKRAKEYPHQLSGGMRQRVVIAMALACEPDLIIADEPTTALDVTIQAQILSLMNDLQQRLGMSMILITHDLGVVAEVCDEVAVMYAGKIVEHGSSRQIYSTPRHPYTKGLMASIPKLGQQSGKLSTIPGMVPTIKERPMGCRFSTRCTKVQDKCRTEDPSLSNSGSHHLVSCWFPEEQGESQ